MKQQQASIPPSSSVARTLSLTPTASPLPLPPTSPMKKDLHSFKFPGVGASVAGVEHGHDRRSTVIGVKLQKIGQEPASNSFAHFGPVLSGMRSRHSSGAPSIDPRKNLMSPSTMADPLSTPPPAKVFDKKYHMKERMYYIDLLIQDQISAEDREVCRLLSSKLAPKDFEKETHALSQSWVQSREGTPSNLPPSRPDSLLQVSCFYKFAPRSFASEVFCRIKSKTAVMMTASMRTIVVSATMKMITVKKSTRATEVHQVVL